nr:MAG TPA: hypothetical protein [Caudoviricetes sp.]
MICNKIKSSLYRNRNNRFILSVDDLPFSYHKTDEAMHIIANDIIRKKNSNSKCYFEIK